MIRGGVDSPLGPLRLAARDGALLALDWAEAEPPEDPLLAEAAAQLSAYFEGRLRQFDLPLAPKASAAGARVLGAMLDIPFGETRTYGEIGAALKLPAQAVGQLCGANPIPILIPCHRVLGATSLGGYSGAGGVETKVRLLRHENAAGLLI